MHRVFIVLVMTVISLLAHAPVAIVADLHIGLHVTDITGPSVAALLGEYQTAVAEHGVTGQVAANGGGH